MLPLLVKPAPRFSSRLYVRLEPGDIALFRYLLEAEDNLAYITTVDRWASVICVTSSPHQDKALKKHLASMNTLVPFKTIYEARAVK